MAFPIRRIAAAGLAATVGILIGSFPGEARAGFASQSTPIAAGSQLVLADHGVAVDGAGKTTVVWASGLSPHEVVQARRVAATGVASPTLPLSQPTHDSSGPAVASNTGGRSFAVWDEYNEPGPTESVKGRWIERNGKLGPVLTLLNGTGMVDATNLEVVIAPSGTATVTWVDQGDSDKLRAIRVSPAGVLSAPVPDFSGGGAGTGVQVVALGDGTTLAVWRGAQIESNTLSPSGTPGTPATLSTSGLVGDPGFAVDGAGAGLVAWRAENTVPTTTFEVDARRLDSTGTPVGSEFTVDPAAAAFAGVATRVSADSNGRFLVTWDRQDSGGNGVGFARRVDDDGTLHTTQTVAAGPGSETGLVSALQDRGSAAVGWSFEGPGPSTEGARGRILDSGGVPVGGAVLLHSGGAFLEWSSRPSANVGAFVFQTFSSMQTISLVRFLSPPICSSSKATAQQAEPVDIPIACTGPGITNVKVVSGPKHGKVGAFNASRGTVRYQPKRKFAGTDRFKYRAVSGGGQSGVVTVTVRVVRDKDRPRITSFSLLRSGSGRHTKFRFVLTYGERATARIKVFERVGGHFQQIAVLGSNKPRTSSSVRIPHGLAQTLLGGGKFKAAAVATDPPGNRSKPKSLKIP